MGEVVVCEENFPCPCGKGILHIEVREHDTYASGRHSVNSLECPDCEREYREFIETRSYTPVPNMTKSRRDAFHFSSATELLDKKLWNATYRNSARTSRD